MTRKKQGNRINKKSSGGEPLKAAVNESKFPYSVPLFKAGVGLAKEGKRKASGSPEPNKVEPSGSGPTNHANKGLRNLKPSKGQKDSSVISNGTTNSNFKFSSEARKDKSGHSGGTRMENDGATSMDLQIGQAGKEISKSRSLEDCISAISNTVLMQIQPEVDTDGKKVANKPPYLNLSNGEQKLTETDLDMPFHDRGQLAILGQRDDDGSAPTMCLSHSKEGLLQEIEKPDLMEFEE
nr:hypothetical protein CFP56_27913 [Quercus suber]